MSKEYKIVTVSDRKPREWYYLYDEFYKSLKDEAANVLILSPELMGQRFNGLGTKPKWLYRAIKEKMINTPYIIFTDSWDMVFAERPQLMMEFLGDEPLVISAERNCFPEDCKEGFDKLEATSSFKYLNSGFIVGKTEALLAVLEAMDLPNQPEDHRLSLIHI